MMRCGGLLLCQRTLVECGLNDPYAEVVDFGCGCGMFTISAAQSTAGTVHALDIDNAMLSATVTQARSLHLTNTNLIQHDTVTDRTGLDNDSAGYVMLLNVSHAEGPISLLREVHRVLRPGVEVAITHWVYDKQVAGAARDVLEAAGNTHMTDLHVWPIGPGLHTAEIVITADTPKPANDYKGRLPKDVSFVHVIVGVHERPAADVEMAPITSGGTTSRG